MASQIDRDPRACRSEADRHPGAMKPTSYLTNLTSLRGVAAVLTVIYHVDLMLGDAGGLLLHHTDSLMFTRLYLMVDFFFILSGFIMLHVYGTSFGTGVTAAAFRKFTLARFARVYPLHLATLLYCIGMYAVAARLGVPENPVAEAANSGYSIVTNLLLLQSMNVHDWFSWVHASWSISTEWWMYMLFPFLVVPFARIGAVGRAVVAALCFAGYVGIMVFIIPIVTVPASIPFVKINPADLSIDVAYQYGIIRCFFGFVIGMTLYMAYQHSWGKRWLGNGYAMLALVGCEMLSLHVAAPDVLTVTFLPLILLSAAYGSRRMDVLLGSKPMRTLGDWSFSIYLTHQPLLFTWFAYVGYRALGTPSVSAASRPLDTSLLAGWGECGLFIALALVVSSLTYRYVELPARQHINAWARRVA